MKKVILRLLGYTMCDHDYKIHGWTWVKCKKCNNTIQNKKLYREAHDKFTENRAKRLESWGWDKKRIEEDISHVDP